ncbi:hypothetical protein [Rhizobium sp. S163]|uniref:hypothetical protein n=1 Tax=Rhizobium sp. S163 TaxID=3055039 RepID=UPI0025A96D9A|nr:hypothetical protein [Rhizobium sp. S163]MDM9644500.1 hypothetical protein [Rhizobium sp. S163]
MNVAVVRASAWFTLHIQCDNCMRDSEMPIEMPVGDDVPRDVEELIESVFLERLPFRCQPCGGVIGKLIGINGGGSYDY